MTWKYDEIIISVKFQTSSLKQKHLMNEAEKHNVLLVFMSFTCSDTDVHTVASLLKLYLRELPVPVVPWTQYHDFLSCTESLDSEVCLQMQSDSLKRPLAAK